MGVDQYSWPQMTMGNFSHSMVNIVCLVLFPNGHPQKDLLMNPHCCQNGMGAGCCLLGFSWLVVWLSFAAVLMAELASRSLQYLRGVQGEEVALDEILWGWVELVFAVASFRRAYL